MNRSTTFWAAGCYRMALLAFPSRLRALYGAEMADAFAAAHAQRRNLSFRAGRRFAARAWFDAVKAGIGTRFNGGVGEPSGPNRGKVRVAREWLWTELGADLRGAFRALRKDPVFAVTVIAVLALGVGINGALSNALRAVFLAPAPFAEPERLVMLDLSEQEVGSSEPPRAFAWSYPKYEMLANTEGLAASPIAAYARRTVSLTGRGTARQLTTEVVTPDYFAVLAIPAWRGAEARGSEQTMISHGLALALFGDTDPVGQELVLNGVPQTVAGVAPPGFRGLSGRADLWTSMAAVTQVISPTLLDNFDGHWLRAVGRLGAGSTLEELQAQMSAVGAQVHDGFEWTDATTKQVGEARLFEEARRNPRARQAVGVVSAAAGIVLLIACVNLAVLLHARVRGRQRELAVRLALGSSRLRVARILFVEVLLLAAAAGVVGVGVASAAAGAIARAWPQSFVNGAWNVRFVDAAGLQFGLPAAIGTFVIAGAAGMLFGLLPILQATRADVAMAMRAGGRTESGRDTTGHWLVAVEVALALVLTVGAGLMISSLGQLTRVDQGFDPRNLLAFDYSLQRGSAEAENPAAFHDEFLRRVRALPGVVGVTLDCGGGAPLGIHCWTTRVRRAGEARWEEGQQPGIGVHLVDEAHFATMGIPLRSGRVFDASDGAETAPVMVINEAAAERLFPAGDALGQPLTVGVNLTSGDDTAAIIGVVGDVLYNSPAQGTMPEVYVLHRQEPGRDTAVFVRSAGEPLDLQQLLRAELAAIAPDVPLTNVRTVESIGVAALGDTTVVMRLLAAFAALAVLLSATGVWGTVAQAVGRRRREMGIRLALGARTSQVVRQSLQYGLVWAAAGAAVGLLGAYYLSRTLSSLLFEVTPTDAIAYASSALLLVLVSLVASYVPARRAGQVDPAKTLRAE